MKPMHPRYLLLWALLLLPVAAVAWYMGGPFLLRRSVEVPLSAKNVPVPAPTSANSPSSDQPPPPTLNSSAGWTLEWADSSGDTINGRWLELKPEDNGNLERTIETTVPNYEFETLVLRWHAMPGVAAQEPQPATLVERVGGIETRSELKVHPDFVEGTKAASGMLQSDAPDGGMAWQMPDFTIAQAEDILALYTIFLAGFLVLWIAYHAGDGRRWYTPERAALALVIGVHTWMALSAPLLYCPDSVDYAVNAKLLLENHNFEHFNAWRLPGYSVFLAPFVSGLHGFNFAVGLAQAILGVLTAWFAGRAVRLFVPSAWAALAVVVVGLDPVLLSYERHAMPECLAAFMVMAAVFAALRGQFWRSASWPAVIMAALGLGALLGGACYVRGNLLMVVAALPFAIAAWPLAAGLRVRAGVLFSLVLLAAVGATVPWIINNSHRYERTQFVVGAGFTRAFSAIEGGLIDLNQSASFTKEQWDTLRSSNEHARQPWTETMRSIEEMKGTELARRTQALPDWTRQDERANAVARESIARDPHARLRHSIRSLANLLGVWQTESQENRYWSQELRGEFQSDSNHRARATDFTHLPQAQVEDILARTQTDIGSWARTDQARAFDSLWRAAEVIRPLWAVLMLVGVIGALGRRQWSLFVIGAMVIAHAGYLSIILLTGIDRYQASLYPVMALLAVYGLACLAGAAPMAEQVAANTKEAKDPGSRSTRFR